jgi:hypothetical protein|tara:strand:- start:499 stop:693 length:195 start_codon:yes stop_codon:yes gene_type:complete
MRERLKDLITKNREQGKKEYSNKLLNKARKEVEINGNGTSGYVIKEGSQKGRVLKHIQIKSKNI